MRKSDKRGKQPGGRTLRSLKATDAFRSFVLDQLEELGDVTPRSMFGGVGLYHRGVFFGIIARDVLYLKVDDRNRPDYRGAGMKPFKPYRDRPGTMQYLRRAAGGARERAGARRLGQEICRCRRARARSAMTVLVDEKA